MLMVFVINLRFFKTRVRDGQIIDVMNVCVAGC